MPFTYVEVGRTREGDLPAGYRHVRRESVIGHGEQAFQQVREGMRNWQIHLMSGLKVRCAASEPAADVDFSAGLGLLNLRLWVACRVVWVRDEQTAYGYGFGTVPRHPERGEEAFEVTLGDDGSVAFSIRAFSRSASWYAKLGGPITAFLQDKVTDRYLHAAGKLAQLR